MLSLPMLYLWSLVLLYITIGCGVALFLALKANLKVTKMDQVLSILFWPAALVVYIAGLIFGRGLVWFLGSIFKR